MYNDVPYVNKIDFGMYVVPSSKEIEPYIQSVDNGDFGDHTHSSISGYISSESYIAPPMAMLSDPYISSDVSAGYPLSSCEYGTIDKPLSGVNDYYDIVDNECSLAPYVDKLYWKIDGLSATQ